MMTMTAKGRLRHKLSRSSCCTLRQQRQRQAAATDMVMASLWTAQLCPSWPPLRSPSPSPAPRSATSTCTCRSHPPSSTSRSSPTRIGRTRAICSCCEAPRLSSLHFPSGCHRSINCKRGFRALLAPAAPSAQPASAISIVPSSSRGHLPAPTVHINFSTCLAFSKNTSSNCMNPKRQGQGMRRRDRELELESANGVSPALAIRDRLATIELQQLS